jgi:putative SOS response-associated peptidase YedK
LRNADTKLRKTPTWFASNEDRPLAFAGIWTSWHGKRGTLVEGEHKLFGFLTTVQLKSRRRPSQGTPVIFTQVDQIEAWLGLPCPWRKGCRSDASARRRAQNRGARVKEAGAVPELPSAEPRLL